MNEYRLLIETDDQKGLVYKISKIIYDYGLNIETNSEYVDKEVKKFFMRTVISGEFDQEKLLEDIKSELPIDSLVKLTKKAKKDIVLLATKELHCLGDLLIKHEAGELDANIKAVISNHNLLQSLVEKFDIPFEYVSHEGLSREDHEELIIKAIKKYDHELIVLAKYMRILTPKFVETFEDKIINIHHSFLPAFQGANPYKRAYERGVKLIGATAHYATIDLDEGPIIEQGIERVTHDSTPQTLKRIGADIERLVLAKAVKCHLQSQIIVANNRAVVFPESGE